MAKAFFALLIAVLKGKDNVSLVVTVLGLLGGLSARLTKRFGAVKFGSALFFVCLAACVTLAVTSSAAFSVLSIILLGISFNLFQPLQIDVRTKQSFRQTERPR